MAGDKNHITIHGKHYSTSPSSLAWRLTDCCAAYSKFVNSRLVCSTCQNVVKHGQGDGHKIKTVKEKRYVAVRVWCWTDQKQLWKVLTRPVQRKSDAETYLEMEKDEQRSKGHRIDDDEYFIVAKMTDVPFISMLEE